MSEYRHRTHINAVLGGSQARHAARSILQAFCHFAEFDRPECTVTKPQLEKHCRLCAKTVKIGLRFLKDEGSIQPIRHVVGGRGHAVTYRLCAVGQGAQVAPGAAKSSAGGGDVTLWDNVAALYKRTDPAEFRNWLAKVQFGTFQGAELVLIAQSEFAARHCQTHLADNVLAVGQSIDADLRRVRFTAA